MNANQWTRVKEIFHAALEQDVSRRVEFVVATCAGDAELQAEVERLLAAHPYADGFLEPPPGMHVTSGRLSGQRLGRYEVGRLVGVGGMGEVYAARDLDLGREVAIKTARADAGSESRLREEAQRASRLNHPHICTIYEVGSADGHAYIAMEYIAGHSLRDIVPPEGLPLDDVVRIGTQIADAIAYAHANGIVHRDLKPANVMVCGDKRAKVLDFGLARGAPVADGAGADDGTHTHTAPGTVLGTPAYMAPELLRGRTAAPASDIWALGVMLHELASGARPFEGTTSFEITAAILQQAVPRSPRIPEPLQRIVDRCLSKDPRGRYANAREISAALAALRPETSPSNQGARTQSPLVRWRHTPRARLVLVACGVVAALGAGGWWWGRDRAPVAVGAAGRPAIAVMTFDNLAGSGDTAWLSQGVPSMLLTGLAQTRGLDIVSLPRLHEVARQMGGENLESMRRDQFAELARRAGAGAIVVGGIARTGTEFRIDAQLEDLGTGRLLTAQSVRGSDVFLLVDQLAARMRGDLGLPVGAGIRQVAEISTTSLEAFRLYASGVDAFVNYRWDAAESALQRAVAIDNGFADAYLHLAHVNFFLGRPARQHEYLGKAAEHRDRLGARQRLMLDVESSRAAGDGPTAARSLDQLIATFPDDEDAYNIAFQLYAPVTGLVNDPQKFLIIAARGAAAVPTSGITRNLYAYALLFAGRHEEALAEFSKNVESAGREFNPHDSLGEARVVTGDPAGAIESYERARALDPSTVSHTGRAWALGMLGRFDEALAGPPPAEVTAFLLSRSGRHRDAARALDDAKRQAGVNGDVAEQGQLLLLSALLALERRDYAPALRDCDAAEQFFARLPKGLQRVRLALVHTMRGLTLVAAGRVDEARKQLDASTKLFDQTVEAEKWWSKALEGEIALVSKDPTAAAAAFSAGQPAKTMWFEVLRMSLTIVANHLTARDGLARVARAQHDPGRALQIYRQLLAGGAGQKFVSVFEPRYVLESARLLEESGDRQAAIREYRTFQQLWARADADAPELAEARRAVARLSAAR